MPVSVVLIFMNRFLYGEGTVNWKDCTKIWKTSAFKVKRHLLLSQSLSKQKFLVSYYFIVFLKQPTFLLQVLWKSCFCGNWCFQSLSNFLHREKFHKYLWETYCSVIRSVKIKDKNISTWLAIFVCFGENIYKGIIVILKYLRYLTNVLLIVTG